MVAAVTGSGLGLFNASQSILGAAGLLGLSVQGQAGARAYVNAATGNLVLQGLDQHLSGRGLDLDLLRTYNSQGTFVNSRVTWSWDGERTVKLTAGSVNTIGSQVTRTTGDGHTTVYTYNGTAYTSTDGDGAHDSLTYDTTTHQWTWVDGSTRLTDVYGDSQSATTVGRLQSQTDVSGNKITFGYSSGGSLTTITDFGSGQQVRLVYSTSSPVRLVEMDTFELQVDSNDQVSDPPTVGSTPTQRVLYEYVSATDSRLAKVKTDLTPLDTTDSKFFVTAYTYDGTSGRIASITQNDGSASGGTPFSVSFTYEQIPGSNAGNPSSWRVKTVADANGKQTFNYKTGGTDIVISDPLGGNAQTWTYSYDSNKQLTQIQSPAPVTGDARLNTQFFYEDNGSGNVTKITDARGKSVIYQYDSHGNWIVQRDELGDTIARTYDANNQLLSETRYTIPDAAGLDEATIGIGSASGGLTTHYVYDDHARLRFTISAEGHVSESRYQSGAGGSGLLSSTRQYTADRYSGTDFSETALASFVASLPDKSQVTLTEFEYDFRGNLGTTKSYASVDANGNGPALLGTADTLTHYIYDGHGQLVHSIVLHGANRDQGVQTSYAYDALGRETSCTDAAGTHTTVYDDKAGTIKVTTAANQQIISSFNGVGQLTSVTRTDLAIGAAGARATQYFYDPQGRLQLTVDAQGGRHFSFYDAAGRLSAQVDSTGHVTGFTYDGDGHVLTQTRYANQAGSTDSWITLDGAGNVTGVTKHVFTIAASGTGVDLITVPAQDRTTTFHYDAAGRLDSTTDAAGTETDTSYDGLSRVTVQQTAGRVTRIFYDGDGRVVGTLDPLGFLTENKYDAAGRLVQTLRYAARSPAATDVAAPVWIGVADQTVAALKPFSVRLPAFDADGDPLKDGFSVVGTLPSWLTMTPDDGGVTLSGTPPAGFTSYPVTLRASDGRGGQTDVTLNIVVADTPPMWSGALPDVAVALNTAGFSVTLPSATDSEGGAITYSITSALPPGLVFSGQTISGTPTVAGLYTITARATDAQGQYSETNFVIQVGNVPPTWIAVAAQQALRNQPYTFVVPAAADGSDTLTYSIVSAPSWLHLDAVNHTLTGTPPDYSAAQDVVLQARDPSGESVRLSFTITVPNQPVSWPVFTAPSVTAGDSIDFTPPAAVDPDGGTLTYFVSKGALPAGWTIDSATGRIRGTTNYQKIGSYPVTLSVRDDGHSASGGPDSFTQVDQQVTFVVADATPVFTGTAYSNVDVFANSSGSFSFSKSLSGFSDPDGGPLTFSFAKPSFVTSAIVNGTTVTFAGVIGTTIKTGTITITATDGFGAAVSRSFSVTVEPHSTLAPIPSGSGLSTPADPLAGVRPADTTALSSYVYYDGEGRVVGTVDQQGFLIETVHNEQDNTQQTIRYFQPVTVTAGETLDDVRTDALNTTLAVKSETSSRTFDGLGHITSSTDAAGTVTNFEYDSAGRLTRQVSAAGTSEQRALRTRYDAFGEVTGTVSGEGEAAVADLDTAVATRGTHYVYDSLGRQTQAIDANGHATLFYYDSESRLTHTVNAQGEVTETVYNAFGQVQNAIRYGTRLDGAHTDGTPPTAGSLLAGLIAGTKGRADLVTALAAMPAGSNEVTSYDYEQRGLVKTVTDALGLTTTNTYDAFGELATQQRTIKAAQGGTPAVTTATRFDYDADGRLGSTTGDVGALNFNTQVRYDAFGRAVRSIDAAGKATVTRYDDNGRTVVVTDALGRVSSTQIDALGRTRMATDANGQVTQFDYDPDKRTRIVTTPEGVQVVTSLNRFGQTISVKDGRGNTTHFAYNKDGQLTTTTDALTHVVSTNAYDASGRLSSVTDARGIVTTYSYDAVNRVLLRVVDPTADDHTGLDLACAYEFDTFGRQTTVTCGRGDLTVAANVASVTSYVYDLDNRQTQVIVDPNGLALTTTFKYDGLNNATQVSQGTVASPDQQVTQYVFDKLGRRVQTSTCDLTTTYRYDAAGRVSRTIDANGQSTWFVYDAAGELRQTINALGEVSENFYDADGRIVQTRQYVNRLSAATLASFGDVVGLQAPVANDTLDHRSYAVYDNDGRQRFTLQADNRNIWTISESRFDANGNVIETRRYDQFLDESRINALDTTSSPGITVAEVLTELSTLGYDDNTASTLAGVRRTHFAYDADNRLRFTVDAVGSVSERTYDAAGHVVSTVRYATAPLLSAFDESTIDGAVDRSNAANQVGRFAYDAAGRLRYTLQRLQPASGSAAAQYVVSEQVYDSLNRVVQSRAYSRLLDTAVDEQDAGAIALALQPDSQDRVSAMTYDEAGRLVYGARFDSTSSQYIVSQQAYDAMGRVVTTTAYAKTMALADFTKATLDSVVAANADAQNDRRTDLAYDCAGRLRFTVAADGSLTENVYDAVGRVTEQRAFDVKVDRAFTPITEAALVARRAARQVGDGVTRGQKFTYDNVGRVLTTTDAANYVESNVYNGLGDRTTFTDKNGGIWVFTYDRVGRAVNQIAPAAMVQLSNEAAPTSRTLRTVYVYDALGRLTTKVEAQGTVDTRATRYGYDLLGRQTVVQQPGFYDPASGQVVASFATGRFQRFLRTTYDVLGNVVKTAVNSSATTFINEYKTYDNLGRVTFDIDGLSHTTGFAYDAFGDQKAVTRYSVALSGTPANGVNWTASEVAGQVASDILARSITVNYDSLGRKTDVTQPTAASYFFSSASATINAGSVVALTAAATTYYEYNTFGELAHEAVMLDNVADPSNPTRPGHWRDTWHYFDVMGRETRTIDGLGFHTARNYDALGNLKQVIEYANQGVGGTSGDCAPPPPPVEGRDDRITAFQYDARNELTDTVRQNLRYTALDNSGNYVQQDTTRDGAVTVQHTTYDGLGHVKTQTDALSHVTSYDYNSLGQLTRVTEPARLVAKRGVLDPFAAGNQVSTSPVTDLVLDAYGQVVQSTHSAGDSTAAGDALVTSARYDLGGNAISNTDARGNVTDHQYDFAGRLIKDLQVINVDLGPVDGLSVGSWQTVSHTLERRYGYDAMGRQIETTDVFMDGTVSTQTGQRQAYNAFGEVTDQFAISGAASVALGSLTALRVMHANYDNAGQMTDRTAADGRTTYLYNLAGQVTRQEQLSRVTETVNDVLGRVTVRRLPTFTSTATAAGSAPTTVYSQLLQSYDRWGNVIAKTSQGTVFDSQNNALISSRTSTYEYNADNAQAVEHQAAVTAYKEDGTAYRAALNHEQHYDLLGRLVQAVDSVADDSTTQANEANAHLRGRDMRYNAAGQMISETDYRGFVTHYAYDANGKRIATQDALGHVYVDGFDSNGNLTSHSVLRLSEGADGISAIVPYTGSGTPIAHKLNVYTYDQANRRVSSADLVGSDVYLTLTQYDERSLARASFKIETLPDHVWTPQLEGRLMKSCTYDAFGNKTSETDASKNVQTWDYNVTDEFSFGRLRRMSAGGLTTDYAYNEFGQARLETYSGGNISTVAGDRTDRIYTYHDNGLLKSLTDESVVGTVGAVGDDDYRQYSNTTSYAYTALGELAAESFQRAGVLETAERRFNDQTGDFEVVRVNAPVAFTDPVDSTTSTTYDELGRVATVSSTGLLTHSTLSGLNYSYDEFGNYREIQASYTPQGGAATSIDKWFKYDSDGRVTLIDGRLQNGKIVLVNGNGMQSTQVTYDALGRRATTEQFVRFKSYNVQSENAGEVLTQNWYEYYDQTYSYNDLNALTLTQQGYSRRDGMEFSNLRLGGTVLGDQDVAFVDLEKRSVDALGRVVSNTRHTAVFGNNSMPDVVDGGQAATTTTSNYLRGTYGNMYSQQVVNLLNPDTSNPGNDTALTTFSYDANGFLKSSARFTGGISSSQVDTRHTTTTKYTYRFVFGQFKEDSVTVTDDKSKALNGITLDDYDARGNLITQTESTDNRTITKTFGYNASGQIVQKAQLDSNPPSGLPEDGSGRADYFFANGQSVGTIGIGSLSSTTQFGANLLPLNDQAPGSYTVVAGDTLAGIAQSMYGDSQLWYLIADANGSTLGPLDLLPNSQVGQTYRIPIAVNGNRNNSNTFTPYNPTEIIGSSLPMYGAAPPPSACDRAKQVISAAVVMAAQALITAGAAAVAGNPALGAFLGNLLAQGLTVGLGLQKDISTRQAVLAGQVAGVIGAVNAYEGSLAFDSSLMNPNGELVNNSVFSFSGGFRNSFAQIAQNSLLATATTTWANGGNIDWRSTAADLGTQLAVHGGFSLAGLTGAPTSRFDWLGGAEAFATGSLNPNTGWVFNHRDWEHIAVEAGNAFGHVVNNAILWHDPHPGPQPTDPLSDAIQNSNLQLSGGGPITGVEFASELSKDNAEKNELHAALEEIRRAHGDVLLVGNGGGVAEPTQTNLNPDEVEELRQIAEEETAIARADAAAAATKKGPVYGPIQKPHAKALGATADEYFDFRADPLAPFGPAGVGAPAAGADPAAGPSRTVVVDRQAPATDDFAELDRAGFNEQTQTSSESLVSTEEYIALLNQKLADHQWLVNQGISSPGEVSSAAPDTPWITHEAIIRELRASGTPDGEIWATLLERDPGRLSINLVDPANERRAGFEQGGHSNINQAELLAEAQGYNADPLSYAAQVTVHELRHGLQPTGWPSKARELEAIQAEVAVYPDSPRTRGFGWTSTAAIKSSLDDPSLYRDPLPEGDPNWYADNHHITHPLVPRTSGPEIPAVDWESEAKTVREIPFANWDAETIPEIPQPGSAVPFVGRWGGRALLGYGIVKDSYSFGSTWADSSETGNYIPLYREAARISTAWGGAYALGSGGAELGAVVGGPFGAFFGGLVGGGLGYAGGPLLVHEIVGHSEPKSVAELGDPYGYPYSNGGGTVGPIY